MWLYAECPICGFSVILHPDVEASEVVSCEVCSSSLVVGWVKRVVLLEQAPKIEEDWGE